MCDNETSSSSKFFSLFYFTAEKYCKLLNSEGGLLLLQAVIDSPNENKRIKELAAMVVEHVTVHLGLEEEMETVSDE